MNLRAAGPALPGILQDYTEGDQTLLARGAQPQVQLPEDQGREGAQVSLSLSPNCSLCAAPSPCQPLDQLGFRPRALLCHLHLGADMDQTQMQLTQIPFTPGAAVPPAGTHFCILCPVDILVLSLDLAFWWLGTAFLTGSSLCHSQDSINSAFSHTEPWDFYGRGTKMHK